MYIEFLKEIVKLFFFGFKYLEYEKDCFKGEWCLLGEFFFELV